jgi:hypothetical protein
MGYKGIFEKLRDKSIRKEFDNRILDTIDSTPMTVITVLIDKKWILRQRHWSKSHPYIWLLELLIERYVYYLRSIGEVGDIMPESRQSRKDTMLQDAFELIRERGTRYVPRVWVKQSIPSASLKFRTKRDLVAGLQICDLVAFPSHMYAREKMGHSVEHGRFTLQVLERLQSKYYRSPTGWLVGYGLKHMP